MYKVIKHFIDLHDNDHSYNVGDIFPREGVKVEGTRIQELAGSNNKQGTPLIELVEEPEEKEPEDKDKKTPVKTTKKKTQNKQEEDKQGEEPPENSGE